MNTHEFYELIKERIRSGEFRGLGLEAIHWYEEADAMFFSDPDFPCMLAQMAGDGFFPALSREQVRAFMALMLALSERIAVRDGAMPLKPTSAQPEEERTPIPEAFIEALRDLDLESL